MINPINSNQNNQMYKSINNNQKNILIDEKNKNSEKVLEGNVGVVVDIKNEPPKSVTYGKGQRNLPTANMNEVWEAASKFTENFKVMVKDLLLKQGISFNDVLQGKELKVDEKGRELAKESIMENGEFGVKKVTERIVEFAKILANGDKEKISELREAIKKGFVEAEKILGKLPDISKETYDSVMKELDSWEKEDSTSEKIQIKE